MTHTHQLATRDPLLADAAAWTAARPPADVLRQIGSPFAPAPPKRPAAATSRPVTHAA